MYKAVVFDIGQTLVEYNKPLNWSKLYLPALEFVANECGYVFTEDNYKHAINILMKYNTRINPRDYEVSSNKIFIEILSEMGIALEDTEKVKACFYSYFRQDVSVFPEVEETLRKLLDRKILLGTLSDVAYGMDNVYALADIEAIRKYIEYPFTSNDVGYRKPCAKGLLFCAEKMQIDISKLVFVGDEEKDILCAKNAGAYAVLINRSNEAKKCGQDREIQSLLEVVDIVDGM